MNTRWCWDISAAERWVSFLEGPIFNFRIQYWRFSLVIADNRDKQPALGHWSTGLWHNLTQPTLLGSVRSSNFSFEYLGNQFNLNSETFPESPAIIYITALYFSVKPPLEELQIRTFIVRFNWTWWDVLPDWDRLMNNNYTSVIFLQVSVHFLQN